MKIIPVMTFVFVALVVVKGAIFLEEEDVDIPDPISAEVPSFSVVELAFDRAKENISDSWDAPGLFDNTTTGFWDFVTGDTLSTVLANAVEIFFEAIDFAFTLSIQSFIAFGVLASWFVQLGNSFLQVIVDVLTWSFFFVTIAFTPIPDSPWFVNAAMIFFSGLYILALTLNIFRGSEVS